MTALAVFIGTLPLLGVAIWMHVEISRMRAEFRRPPR